MSSLSNSVIRRYTPPTCTLEILAPPSALSRWKKRSDPTQLKFQLRFDDPRLPAEQRMSISGSRAQLDALHQAVTSYVQDLVNKSPAEFGAMFSAAQATNDTVDTAAISDTGVTPSQSNAAPPNSAIQPPQRQIHLQPSKSLSHALSLGTLATPQTGSIIHLSLLQLFDLATALDEYATDVVALPNLKRTLFVYPPAWASIAAVLVATVGVTTAALQYYSRPVLLTNKSTSTQNSINNPQQQIAAPPTIPPLTSLETLPPPPPPAGSIQRVPVPNTTSQLPPTTVAKIPSAAPGNPPGNTTPQTTVITPKQSKITPQSAPTKSPTASKPVAVIPNPLPQFNSPIPQPQTTNPQPIPTFTLPPTQSTLPPSTPTPQSIIPPKQPSTPTPQSLASLKQPSTPTPTRVPQNLTPPKQPQKTAFDSVPQVAEVREYFQRRWEPSAGVRETLEYSLLLDADGSIQRIEPLGQAASRYIDRTGMPLLGENFVSPSKNGATPRIRLVLSPDGKVRSFLEPE